MEFQFQPNGNAPSTRNHRLIKMQPKKANFLKYTASIILADGAPLRLPNKPIPEGEGIYPTDYFPTLEGADWDGDRDGTSQAQGGQQVNVADGA